MITRKYYKIVFTSIVCLFFSTVYSQTNKELARSKALAGIKYEDDGKIEEAILLFLEAKQLDSSDFNYPYELGNCYYIRGNYKKALEYFQSTLEYAEINATCYQMLGNTYDMLGDSKNAIKSYNDGLSKFPKAGSLYLEKGTLLLRQKEYSKAAELYENGVNVDPTFPSNYYKLANLYSWTSERIWSVLYGEIFMNLERGTKRTGEIGSLLYQVYKKSINVTSDTSGGVDFSKSMSISTTKPFKLPFQLVYGTTMTLGLGIQMLSRHKEITISSLYQIRKTFLNNWFEKKQQETYPNILFDYQKKLLDNDHFEAYTYWIFMKGNESEFKEWKTRNEEKWSSFIKWFTDNAMQLDDTHKFVSNQY